MIRNFLGTATLCAMALAATLPARAQQAPGGASAPMQVGVVTMKKQAVPRTYTLPGRAVAFQQVDVRPRVDGVITAILYTPGKPLKVGDPLFQLDDANYAATVAADKAAVAKAQAVIPTDQAAYDRAVKLEGSGFTAAQVETARSDLAEAQADLDSAQAALTYAQTQLSWTTIRSPIQGVADVATVSVGDLVQAAQTDALTTVTRLDPIDVDMLEPSARILSVRDQIEKGTLKPNQKLQARLTLENGQVYTGTGTFVAPSATVSTSTGTVTFRFRFENPKRQILPGMFLRGEVTAGTVQAFLVPQTAADPVTTGGLSAFIVGPDGKAKAVTLQSIGEYKNRWIVTTGLTDGDRLIVDGLKTMRAGTAVKPVAAKINEDGVAVDATEKGDAAAPVVPDGGASSGDTASGGATTATSGSASGGSGSGASGAGGSAASSGASSSGAASSSGGAGSGSSGSGGASGGSD